MYFVSIIIIIYCLFFGSKFAKEGAVTNSVYAKTNNLIHRLALDDDMSLGKL